MKASLCSAMLTIYNRPIISSAGPSTRVATFQCLNPGRGPGASVMASAGARAYNGGLGAEPPAGPRGRAPGQGIPPEGGNLLAFGCAMEAANLPHSVRTSTLSK